MAGPTILQNEFVVYMLLPFLLVFVIVFAILQKTKILGEGKKQIDAIVGLIIGLIVVAFTYPTQIIVWLMPFLAVGLVILLVFMLMWGAVFKQGEFDVPEPIKYVVGALVAIAVIVAVLIFSGYWYVLTDMFDGNPTTLYSILFVILIIVAIVVVMAPWEKVSK